MANQLYVTAKKAFLDGDIDLLSDTIKAVLVDTGVYTVDINAHDFYNDLGASIVGANVSLSGKSTTGGVFDAGDITFTTVSGSTVEAIVLYKDTGTAATSQLIAYIDTATGLPLTPNGGDITITWSNGSNKIFAIV